MEIETWSIHALTSRPAGHMLNEMNFCSTYYSIKEAFQVALEINFVINILFYINLTRVCVFNQDFLYYTLFLVNVFIIEKILDEIT